MTPCFTTERSPERMTKLFFEGFSRLAPLRERRISSPLTKYRMFSGFEGDSGVSPHRLPETMLCTSATLFPSACASQPFSVFSCATRVSSLTAEKVSSPFTSASRILGRLPSARHAHSLLCRLRIVARDTFDVRDHAGLSNLQPDFRRRSSSSASVVPRLLVSARTRATRKQRSRRGGDRTTCRLRSRTCSFPTT